MNSPRRFATSAPPCLGIRQLFALLGVALTDADFWGGRARPRKTRLTLS